MLSVLILSGNEACAKIIAKTTDCLNSSTDFDYTTSSGLNITAAIWSFGDGYTANSVQSSHVYKNTGTFKVKVTVTLSNSSTESDSMMITIVGLPDAKFTYQNFSDTCFYNNNVCFVDKSTPATPGQNIVKRIFLWDDGSSSISSTPNNGDLFCHRYSGVGKYKATMEITDIYGCKSLSNFTFKIVPGVDADFSYSFSFVDCKNAALCFKNRSSVLSPATAKYTWQIDTSAIDYNSYNTVSKCIQYNASKTIKAKLIGKTNTGCTDSISRSITIDLPPLPTALVMLDSVFCYGDIEPGAVSFSPIVADLIEIMIDNKIVSSTSTLTGYNILPKQMKIMPGKHVLSFKIKRGSCIVTLKKGFEVKGPIVNMGIVNQFQCSTKNQVLVYDLSTYSDSLNSTYFWKVKDPVGGANCTTDYNKDLNLYSNCKYAYGRYHKYTFNEFRKDYTITLIVKDNITGCIDSVVQNVDLLRCSKLLDKNNYTICQDDLFYGTIGNSTDPVQFSLDSGATWLEYPSPIKAPHLGLYDVMLIFQRYKSPWFENIGNDSMKLHTDSILVYDTITKKQFLNVKETRYDSLSYKDYTSCTSYRSTIYFKNKLFLAGEKMEVFWGDNTNDVKVFYVNTMVDSISHVYKHPGIKAGITINLYNGSGCFTQYRHFVGFGKTIAVIPLSKFCVNISSCMDVTVTENRNSKKWSSLTNKQLTWIIDSTIIYNNRMNVCHTFTKGGNHKINIIAIDSNGCADTFKTTVFVQEVKANIGNLPKVIFCSELRQFFDSSYCIKTFSDSISKIRWDFGDNTFLTTQKNPFKAFNSSADSVHVLLAVRTVSGCVDTQKISIAIIGAKPAFKIKDTIACGQMEAVFYNLSGKCKSYIWEFGDSAKTSKVMDDTQTVTFFYNKPGRYHIKLYGTDTIRNPSTGNTYHCVSSYPEYPVIRDVVILPVIDAAIISKDTICYGDSLLVKSKDTAYIDHEIWQMGDGTTLVQMPPKPFSYFYKSSGTYTINLAPKVNLAAAKACIDNASKDIVVLGVTADFDIDKSSKPYYTFNNLSQPAYASLLWDFGQPSSGSFNSSTEQNPSHFYGYANEQYTICLTASLPFGCRDSVCKPIVNIRDTAAVKLFNVFTPEQKDNKNDYYDVLIEGEDIYELFIYDRWGILVFHSTQDADVVIEDNWNGKVMNVGNDCPSGTYFYLFKYRIPLLSSETKLTNGVIQLIR